MYHYLECGLANIYLINGFPFLECIDNLHAAIGKLLVQKSGSLDGHEILFLRREMGMTQSILGKKVGVSIETLRRWERGRSRVKPEKDVSLRALYLGFVGCPCSRKVLARLMSLNDQEPGFIVLEHHQRQWYLSPKKILTGSPY